MRDLPDVSLFAANGVFGHYDIFCYTDPAPGAGGTSFASPIVAGVQAPVDSSTGTPQGTPNNGDYALARQELGTGGNNYCDATLGNGIDSKCNFHDVTERDMDVNCLGTFNGYTPSGTNGILSAKNKAYEKSCNSNTGWDFATGIGTLNVGNLRKNWGNAFYLTMNETE